jgi:5-methylcytosine-specific restriction protein A
MSYQRRAKLKHKGYGPNGFNLCYCGCGQEVKPPKQNWASRECVDNYFARNDPAYQRRQVEHRDRGVCAACGLDTATLEKRLHDFRNRMFRIKDGARRTKAACRFLATLPNPERWKGSIHFDFPSGIFWRHLWEMDHILPVVEGGGECDLTNLRTLCIPCHKDATAALARRRAQLRREGSQVGQGKLFA